jgi:hypothetical protein
MSALDRTQESGVRVPLAPSDRSPCTRGVSSCDGRHVHRPGWLLRDLAPARSPMPRSPTPKAWSPRTRRTRCTTPSPWSRALTGRALRQVHWSIERTWQRRPRARAGLPRRAGRAGPGSRVRSHHLRTLRAGGPTRPPSPRAHLPARCRGLGMDPSIRRVEPRPGAQSQMQASGVRATRRPRGD